jgi:hypothetical protein
MTKKEALRKLEAYIKCINIQDSENCDYDCSNCKLGLEQGNKLLVNESLKIAFDALKQVIATEEFAKTGSLYSFNEAMELIKKYKGR